MQNKHLIWATCAVLTCVGIYVFTSTDLPMSTTIHNTEIKTVKAPTTTIESNFNTLPTTAKKISASSQPINTKQKNVEERITAMRERRPDQTFDPATVAAALTQNSAWEPTENVPTHLPLRSDEFTDGRQFIQFDSLKLETLMPGDTIKLNINEVRKNYDITIDRVETNDYNSVSWFGHIDGDDGQAYSVSFTRGKELTVSGIDTPEGHYVLQAQGNDGWIASSSLLYKVDPTATTDVVDPPTRETQ
jgi:hypothetical protein